MTARPPARAERPAFKVSLRACAVVLGLMLSGGPALAQFNPEPKAENPVFVDERPGVAEALARSEDHLRAGNIEQAVRTLQKALDEHADGVVVSKDDPALYQPVRQRVHLLLQSDARLLEAYRTLMGPGAEQLAGEGRAEELERTRFLTAAGLAAAIELAQRRALAGQFDGAAMTLLQTASHPERPRKQVELAAAARVIGRYVTDPPTRDRLALLAGSEGLPDVEPAVRAGGVGFSLESGSTFGLVDDLVSQPLGTGVFGDDTLPIQPHAWDGDESALDRLPKFAREMRSWPVVSPTGVFFSDGKQVTALDRVSMRRLWSVDAAGLLRLPLDDNSRSFNGMRSTVQNTQEEVVRPTLSAGDSLLVSVVGRDSDSVSAEGVEHLAAFDSTTGSLRWSVPLRSLDEQLADAFARGPLVSDGRVVVVHLLKRQNSKRLIASLLLGVDALTGKRLWLRTVGSEGVLPFYRNSVTTDSTIAQAGVVYRYDRLGAFGAYAIADGRPAWVRRLASRVVLEPGPQREQWLVHQPTLTRAGLVVLTPDKDEALLIDAASGAVLGRRGTEDLRQPEYTVATETHVGFVNEHEVVSVPIDQFADGPPVPSGRLDRPVGEKIRGRVTVAGDNLLVPDARGVALINPAAPSVVVRRLPLDVPGSPLALPEGLLVVDDARAHMYCAWSVAADHLRAQMNAAPTDPAPAVELLVLAERAGKSADVLPAARAALEALRAAGPKADPDTRYRTVSVLLRAALRSSNVTVEQAGAALDPAGVDEALAQAGEAAATPSERAAVLLAAGEVSESRSRFDEAALKYQGVVSQPELAAAPAPGARNALAAGPLAVERLTRVIKAGGRGSYARFDGELAAAVASLPADATPDTLESLATRYPLARELPSLWLRTANAHKAAGGPAAERASARALEKGVQAAERAGDTDPAIVGELNGSLIKNLMERGLLPAAGEALARAGSRFPQVVLTAAGVALVPAEITATIERSMAGARRWPRIGPLSDKPPQVIEGWTLMEPLIRPTGGSAAPFVVLHKGDERRSQVALFGLKPGQLVGEAVAGDAGTLSERWFSEMGSNPWTLVRTDPRGALFFVGETAGGRLVRVDAEQGKIAWRTEPFGALFPADAPRRFGTPGAGLRVPIGGEQRLLGEIVLASDDRTVCMVERAGRCAAIDAESGQTLWTNRLPLTRIADAALSAGQLIAVGEHPQPQPDGKLDRVALFDSRTGAEIAAVPAPVSGVRYIRVTSRGDLILGAGGTVVCVGAPDLENAKPAWTLKEHPAANAWEAWLLDDRLFLLGEDRALWEVPAGSGLPPVKPIDVQGRLDGRTAVWVWQTQEGTAVFGSGRGIAVVNGRGELTALDGVNALDGSVAPVMTSAGVLLLAPPPTRQNGLGLIDTTSATTWTLHRLDTATGKTLAATPITFSGTPARMNAIDGRIVVSTSAGSVVIDAPASTPPAP